MPKLYSVIIVAAAVLLAYQIAITGSSGEAPGPSPEPAQSDRWGTWHGLWTDGQGGTLRLVDRGDTILFDISVVRGPTSHTGHINGEAERHRTQARFSERHPTLAGEDEPETWLSFIHRGDTIELANVHTLPYHGARAYFDGNYTRVGSLSEVDIAEVEAGVVGVQ